MLPYRPKLRTAAIVAVLASAPAACGEKDVVKEEPTPLPPTAATPVPPQPSTTTVGAPAPAVVEGGGQHGAATGEASGETGPS